MWNRRRSNAWMTVELILVFILVWYMADYLFVYTCNLRIPNGRDVRNTWRIRLGEYPDAHPAYRAEESSPQARQANFTRILQALHDYPAIEAVGVMYGDASEPGSGSYSDSFTRSPQDTTAYATGQLIALDPEEDFFRVFGYTCPDGRPLSMRHFDAAPPSAVVLAQMTADRLFPSGHAIGQTLYIADADRVVAGVAGNVKRFAYTRPQGAWYVFQRRDAHEIANMRIAVRSREAFTASFRQTFVSQMAGRLQTGNFYLKSVVSYRQIAADTDTAFGISNELRVKTALVIFFLLNILLCVMGAFWYRVNARREEIGIRRAVGSSAAAIRRLLLLEGLCLLAIAALPAMLIEYQFVRAGLIETLGKDPDYPSRYLPDRTHLRFLITNALAFAALAAVIITAVALPARRAAAIPPAEALRDE
jgi:hypothetical protein